MHGINHLIPGIYHNLNDTHKALKTICRLTDNLNPKCYQYQTNINYLTGNPDEKDEETINYVLEQKRLNKVPDEGSQLSFKIPVHSTDSEDPPESMYIVLYFYNNYIAFCEMHHDQVIVPDNFFSIIY